VGNEVAHEVEKEFCKFWKNVRNSSISDWSENFTKNQEKYLKTHGEIRLKKYCIVLKLKIPESEIYRLRKNFHKFIKFSEKVYK